MMIQSTGAVEAAEATLNRRTEIDYLLVADRADVVNGKLYMMGGGWDRLNPQAFPFSLTLGIALGVRVPYAETDDVHRVHVVLERGDGDKLLEIEAELATGRAPGARGMDMLVPMAFNVPLTIVEPGDLVLVADVDGRPGRHHEIRAHARG